jgi:membrane protease YdiL (CAAX protease family)
MIPWRYFTITLGFSWTLWTLAIARGTGLESPLGYVLYLVGGLGPTIGALSLLYLEGDDPLKLVKESVNFGSLEFRAFAVVVAVSVLPNFFAVVISECSVLQPLSIEASPLSLLPWFVFLFMVSIIEEVGWRGYALPRLLKSHSMISSSALLGAVWALWHVPLFLIPGTWQHTQGFGSPVFWRYLIQILPRTFLYTWVYVKNSGSLPSMVAFHSLSNISGELLDLTARADVARMILETLLAGALMFI